MKVTLTFKSPDVMYEATDGMEEEEKEEFEQIVKKWVRYDEYLSVEIDTEAKTCTVLEV